MATYRTLTGLNVPSVTREQMVKLDHIAIEETGPNLYQMMENAGRNLALSALDMINKQSSQIRIIIIAGSGGNGGGGICAARHLANLSDLIEICLCLSSPKKLSEAASYQRKIFSSTHGQEVSVSSLETMDAHLIIDALIGYSLNGSPTEVSTKLIQWMNKQTTPILSLDIPSGIDSTTGKAPGQFINATRTMTLALPKTGLLQGPTGELWLADIGIPKAAFERLNLDYTAPFAQNCLIPLEIQ